MYDYRLCLGLSLAATLAATSLLAPRPAVAADWTTQTAVGLDLGVGGVISPYRPEAQDGGSNLLLTIRASYDFGNDLALQLLFRQWFLPGSDHATMPGVGGRFETFKSSVGRAFLDAAVGPAWTQERVALAYDVGVGYELDVSLVPGLCLGPFFRYGQAINPATNSPDDGRAWALGLSGTFRIGPWQAAAATQRAHTPNAGKPVRPFMFKIEDSDHDGVSDERDQCPEVPAGKHPDSFRPGCPENDEDSDGIPDSDDVCPTDPMGDTPDPTRKGCPFVDSDGDGIADEDDHCPDAAGPKSDDPRTNGCPPVHKSAARPEEREPPRQEETTRDLKPVSKKRMKGPAAGPPQE